MCAKVVAVVGRSGSGKTTLIEAVLPLLGLRVATIKHTHHPLDPDRPGSDSHRHRQAGAHKTALSGPGFCGLWLPDELDPLQLVELLSPGVDLVLLEGYKSGPFARLEVVRDQPPLLPESQVWLTASLHPLGRANELPLDRPDLIAAALSQRIQA
ncbi:MAG: molybdopterin-guanine dinucleotide biosynthesis protein B [Candidatus Eremiobacteraeota bacterium]|nr:molybdopterin-guanine dinucleotide biosynthesis protein B [Candidatus Eremiobacteraeota bacterium]